MKSLNSEQQAMWWLRKEPRRFYSVSEEFQRDASSPARARSNSGARRMAELALVTGRGQALLTTYDGRCPLVRDEDVVAFGFRDEWEAQSYGSPPLAEKIKAIGLEEVRRMGLGPGAREALADVSGQDRCDFGIHFDADALDDAIMPAVDYRLPGGLSWLEIKTHSQCCTCSSESGRHGGHNFQSELDTDGKVLSAFVDMLTGAFARK